MARKRMIDPNIWQSEDFSKLSTLAKIVFIALFSLADDEGRGRANPTYLKSNIFPYEESMRSADVEKTLSEISSNMSVVFYSYNGSSYYSLYNWNKWQKIEKPKDSEIPAFEENNEQIRRLFDDSSTTNRRLIDDSSTTNLQKGSPNKNKNKNKNMNKNRKEKEEKENGMVNIYHLSCPNLPLVQKLTEKRKKAIESFLKEFTVEQFKEICEKANKSDFLIGKNDRSWKADFDFLLRVDKATSVLEGKYDNKKNINKGDSNENNTTSIDKYAGIDFSKNLTEYNGEPIDDTGLI